MSEAHNSQLICKGCGNTEFYALGKKLRKDGTILKDLICRKCNKHTSIPMINYVKIKKNPPCPICLKNDYVHKKKKISLEKSRFYCTFCKKVFVFPYHYDSNYPVCPFCAKNTAVFERKPVDGVKQFYCADCKKKYRDDKKANTPIIRIPCTGCGSRNTNKNSFTTKGKQKYQCLDCKKKFYLNNLLCWKCGSENVERLIKKRKIFRCKTCKTIFEHPNKFDFTPIEDIITPIPAHKKKILYLENEITKLNSMLSIYHRYLTETGLIKNLEQFNKSAKDYIGKDKYHLRIDIIMSNFQIPHSQIIAIVVSTSYDGFYIFKGSDEVIILRNFFKYLNSLPYYTLFVYDIDLYNLIVTKAEQRGIKSVPNLSSNSGKLKGLHDLKIEFDSPSSEFNSRRQEMIKSLNLVPLIIPDNIPEEIKIGVEIIALSKQAKAMENYPLGKNQIKDLFDGSKESELNRILTARIRIIDAIYYNMRWVKDG